MNPIEAFSESLLGLHVLARQTPPHRLLGEALSQFRRLVSFDAGWWGECSAPRADAPPANWQHGSLGLPASFAQEWNAIGLRDDFAQRSMAALGEVCRVSGYDDEAPEVERFSRRHGLFHAMALTADLVGSGLMFFVSLYRREGRRPFDDHEAALFREYCRHLQLHWTQRLQETLRRAFAGGAQGTALSERDGRLLYIGAVVAVLVTARHPGWQGTMLPPGLVEQARRAPCSLRLGRRSLSVRPCGELLQWATAGAAGPEPLSPREREAALLYASGESYKSIARHLGLSPATVRTYLRDVYARLGVRSKLELRGLLGSDTPMR
jgi:DNA-binding CsgD family transcriptional regulator